MILAAAVVSRAAAQPADLEQLRKELLDAEIAVEKARYRIAPCNSEVPGLADFAVKQAKETGIAAFAAQPVDDARPVPNTPLQLRRIEISGRGAFADAHLFLHRIAFEREIRLFDIEALQMTAADGGVQFDVRIAEACWSAEQSTAPPAVHDIAGMYQQRLQQLRGIDAAVKRIGEYMQPMRFVDWLAALDDAWGDLPILLSELHYTAPRLTVKGIALGKAARTSIERAATVQWSPAGECQSFTATAVLPTRDYEEHGFALKEIFDPRAASPCTAGAPPPRTKIAVSNGSGNLTLHARDIDVVSLFRVLNDISASDGYVIASAVVGRVDVDADGATLSEILDALRTAHVAQISDGPLHIVCKSGCAPSKQSFKGELLSMSLTDAEVADVLQALGAAVAPAKLRIPPGVGGTISIFATDLEWDRLFDAIVIAARNASAPARAPRIFTVRDAGKMSVDDVRLAALAGTAGSWHAYTRALGDAGMVVPITTDTALFDGRVESVDGDKVVLRTQDERAIPVKLAPE